jgi:hypothetical protein
VIVPTASTVDNIATADGQNEAATIPSRPPTADAWQLDFCSRPILDERGKKVWELLICDETRTFEYSRYFPNNKINSTQVLFVGWFVQRMGGEFHLVCQCFKQDGGR